MHACKGSRKEECVPVPCAFFGATVVTHRQTIFLTAEWIARTEGGAGLNDVSWVGPYAFLAAVSCVRSQVLG